MGGLLPEWYNPVLPNSSVPRAGRRSWPRTHPCPGTDLAMRHFAELHDTQLEGLTASGEEVVLRLEHAPVFLDVAEDRADVWSFAGTLRIRGAVVDGEPVAGQISEAVGVPNLVELEDEGDGILVRKFRWPATKLILTDGSCLAVSEGEAELRLDRKLAWLEKWTGPLWNESSAGQVLQLESSRQ